MRNTKTSLPEKCPYSELFWSVFSRIRTEYGDLLCKPPYSVQMQEKTGTFHAVETLELAGV